MVGKTVLVMRLSTLLVAGALLVGACSGASTDPSTTPAPLPTTSTTIAPTTTTAAPTTTTTEPPVTTTAAVDPLARPDVLVSNVNRESIDDFDTTGDDLYRVVVELLDLFTYLEGNPTGTAEEMVSLMFERSYPHWDPIMASFRELTDNSGWHYVDAGFQLLGVELVESDGEVLVARVADQRGDQAIADETGAIVQTYQGWDRRATTITFERGADGMWRFADAEPSEDVSDAEVGAMVPVEWTGRTP